MKVKCSLGETCQVTARMLGAHDIADVSYCYHFHLHDHDEECDESICGNYRPVRIPGASCV